MTFKVKAMTAGNTAKTLLPNSKWRQILAAVAIALSVWLLDFFGALPALDDMGYDACLRVTSAASTSPAHVLLVYVDREQMVDGSDVPESLARTLLDLGARKVGFTCNLPSPTLGLVNLAQESGNIILSREFRTSDVDPDRLEFSSSSTMAGQQPLGLVSLTATARIMVQYDNRPAMQLVAFVTPELPSSDFLPSRADAALAALSWQHSAYDAGTLGGPFATDRDSADLVTAATTEFIVPSGVSDIRVWAESPDAENVAVALQYRASRRYRLSESQYAELVRRSGGAHQAFVAALDDEVLDQPDASITQSELQNHWQPFVLYLRTHERYFTAGVQRDTQNIAATKRLPEAVRQRQFDVAVRLTSTQSWLPALEAWSELLPHLKGAQRREAVLARVSALLELPEAFLAERELRSLYLLAPDAQVRQIAFEKLRQFHRRRGNLGAEERLLAAAVMRERTDERLGELAEVLLENGRSEYALMAALAVTAPRRPVSVIVRAAYQMRWWQVFDDTVWQLPEVQQSHYWLAQRHLTLGDYAVALEHFAQAGETGAMMAGHFRSGQQIHAMLRDSDAATRAQGVLAWEQWQTEHPGPQVWREDGSLVTSYAGAESVYRVNRDSYSQTYKAQPDRPIVLSVLGPMRLKLAVRPIHQRDDEAPLNDMLYVRAPGREYLFPINNNYAAVGLQIVGDSQKVPGGAVIAELDIGPGLHEIELRAAKTDVLVRAFVQRPETPLPVLPPLGHDVFNAVLTGHFGTTIGPEAPMLVHLLPLCDAPLDLPLVSQTAGCERSAHQVRDGLDALLAGRLALRTRQPLVPHAAVLLDWTANLDSDNHREKMLILARLRQMRTLQQVLADDVWKIPVAEQQAVYAATGNYKSALDVACDDDPDALLQHLAILIELTESGNDAKLRGAVRGNQLAASFPHVPGLAASTSRLSKLGTWTPYREIITSNGIHGKSIEGWQPETPSLRVRKALLSNKRYGDNILSGYQHLVLAMQNPQPTVLEMSLSLGQLASLRSLNHVVEWQLDDQPSERIMLKSVKGAQSLRVEVPQGAHRLRLWLVQPLANQYVFVSVHEHPVSDEPTTVSEGTQLVKQTERLYHVATNAEPVRFRIDGPAQVRIDELRGEVTLCRYLTVDEGSDVFDLRPAAGEDIALFRIFEYGLDATKLTPPVALETVQPEPLAAPLIGVPEQEPLVEAILPVPIVVGAPVEEISPGTATNESWLSDIPVAWRESLESLSLMSPDIAPAPGGLFDTLPLGGQEDGTWALGLGFVSRRALDEGPNGGSPGRFMEWKATHRYSDQVRSSYQKTDLLLRLREQSGPTIGLRHAWWHEPDHLPFNVGWKGSAYLQQPGGAIPPLETRPEWSLGLSGQLWQRYELSTNWHHTPSATVFGRLLSRQADFDVLRGEEEKVVSQ